MCPRKPTVYILASGYPGTLYIGVTSHLVQRVQQHKDGVPGSFSNRYGVNRLVYYEVYTSMYEAITREKQLKAWKREWKLRLIETVNPSWKDLTDEW